MALIQAQLVNPPAGGRTGGVRAGANITIAADGTISSTGGGGGGLTGLQEIDDISGSFNGATVAFPITISGGLPIPAGPGTSQLVIALGGITQTPGDAFTFDNATDTITFTAAPPAGVSFAGWIGGDAGGVSSVTAGAGLTGGGTGAVTLAVGAGTGITVGAGTVGLAPTGVIAGSYTNANISINAQGQILTASNGSGGTGVVWAWASVAANGSFIQGSNIASTTRDSFGIYTLTFTTPASTANYVVAGSVTLLNNTAVGVTTRNRTTTNVTVSPLTNYTGGPGPDDFPFAVAVII